MASLTIAEKTKRMKQYGEILQRTTAMIRDARQDASISRQQVAELYSIYYNAFAGALRNGALYKKTMDYDGYPKYELSVDGSSYICRDAALRDILGDKYTELTAFPYENNFESYVKVYAATKADQAGTSQNLRLSDSERIKQQQELVKAEERKQQALLKEKSRQLLIDAKGFEYDPNYDHYYSDILPGIEKELDSTVTMNAMRIVCITLSVIGTVLCCMLL